jgi:hypothetical protein
MLDDKTHARHLVELGFLEGAFKKKGIETVILEKSEQIFLHTLVVTMSDYKNRDMNIVFHFVPLEEEYGIEHAHFVQVYTVLPFVFDIRFNDDLGKLILNLNNRVLLGLFGLKDGKELYYRYVYSSPQADMINIAEFMDNFELYIAMLNLFEEYVESVSTGKAKLQDVLEEIDRI